MYPQFRYSKAFEKGLIFSFLWVCLIFSYDLSKAQCTSLNLFATNAPLNCISSTASATVTCFNCTGTVSYTWLPVGGNGPVANNLPPNSYTIIAQDGTGCTGQTNLIILNNTGVNVFMSALTPPCTGTGSGTVTANVVGPVNFPLTYSWTPAATNSSVITGAPGNYSVLVTDNIGCVFSGTTIMNAPNTYEHHYKIHYMQWRVIERYNNGNRRKRTPFLFMGAGCRYRNRS
jgi:hypothetical protein